MTASESGEENLSLRRELEALREAAERERVDLQDQLEDALEERDRAQAVLDKKTEALARLSHELRTPMSGILGMTGLALQTELSEKQREYLAVVSASADVLLTLINDILDLSKLDAGRVSLEAIPFDLRDTVQDSMKSLAPLIAEKDLEVEVVVADDVPATVVGDPGRLRQVLLNLASNAVKFTRAGRIDLSVELETSTAETSHLHFRVADEGIGIPADRLDTIFEPYLQASDSTAREYGGTGLGLAISRDLVALMDGRIWVESVEGEGSVFHFTARLDSASAIDGEPLATLDELANLVVYVLGTEAQTSSVAQQMDPAGIRFSMFHQVETALEAVAERRPDVLVIDLDHHELEVVARIDRDVRTIVITSSGQRGDAARCRELGVAAYLTRPLGPLDLRDAVRAIVIKAEETLITRHWLREHRPCLRVLAADDSSSNRQVLMRMLEMRDHEVVAVSDGREAVEAYDPSLFDVILMDIEMPDMNGMEAARALRNAGVETPIIALTGHASPELTRKASEAGMNAALSKPLKFNELIDAVEATAKKPEAPSRSPEPGVGSRSARRALGSS